MLLTTEQEREVALPALILLLEAWEGSAEVSFVKRLCCDVDTALEALRAYRTALAGRVIGIPELREAQAKARAVLGSDVSEN